MRGSIREAFTELTLEGSGAVSEAWWRHKPWKCEDASYTWGTTRLVFRLPGRCQEVRWKEKVRPPEKGLCG